MLPPKMMYFHLIDLSKYYVKNHLRRNMSASYPNRYFQLQSSFLSDTARSYVWITRVWQFRCLFTNTRVTLSTCYFVFVYSVNLLTVARIMKSVFKIRHATKPVCWYSKIQTLWCLFGFLIPHSSFLIPHRPLPAHHACRCSVSPPRPISGIDAFAPPNPPGPPLPPPHDGRCGPRGSG